MGTDQGGKQPDTQQVLESLSLDIANLTPDEREEFLLLREEKARAENDTQMLQALKIYLNSPFPESPKKSP